MARVALERVEKRFGDVSVIPRLDLDIADREFVVLVGPSGCGKTTTLRMIAGLESPSAGEIRIKGQRINELPIHKRNLGIVFQNYALFPHKNIAANVGFGLKYRNVAPDEIGRRVARALEMVRLPGVEDRYPQQLSGGQQQRIALARALVIEPDVLLLDEPLSNLDAQLRQEMRVQLKALQSRLGTAFLYVTHDQAEAMALSHQVAVMHAGRIEQLGSPTDVYEAPATYFVQSFVGRILAFDGVLHAENGRAWVVLDDQLRLTVHPNGLSAGSPVRVALRPEDVQVERLAGDRVAGELVGTVEQITYYGDHFEGEIRVGATSVLLELPKEQRLTRGERVALRVAPDRVKAWPLEHE